MGAVSLKNVNKKIGEYQILRNVSININRGDICGIVGRNASGKSMLFKAITGLITIDSGNIYIFGEDISRGKKTVSIGALIEQPSFLPQYSGYKNLSLLAGINRTIKNEEIKKWMDNFELDFSDKRPYHKYSLGMKQKLGVIAAIMELPKLIILDEPTNNLDTESVQRVQDVIKSLRNHDTTIIIASHNESDIKVLCNKIYTIEKGEIL